MARGFVPTLALRASVLIALLAAVRPDAAAQTRDWPSERAPKPLAAPQVKFPPYEIRTLPNGLKVVAVLHHEQPAVSIRLLVAAGAAQDPPGKPGVASLTAAVLDQGTTTRRAEQIAGTIDTIGGALDTGAGSDLSFVNAVVMKDSFKLAMSLVSDVARRPAFAPEEVERQQQQVLSGLKVSYDDPDYVASVVFDRLVYGFHPYGMPNNGTAESVSRISRNDLVAFHQAFYAPNNAILAIVGDLTAGEAFAGAEEAFGDWARKEVPAPTSTNPPEPTRRLIVIDKPGAVQTEIRVGHIGIPRKHADFMALDLAIKVLGGEGSNRLHRVLRSERGLTYGASADMETLKQTGEIVADTDTRSETSGEALRLIVDEFWRLQRERVGQEELADAKAYLAGSFPLTIETPDAIAMKVLNVLFYGLDLSELQTYRERVNAVAVDDIQRVARTYLKPDRLSIVLVGDSSAFASELRGLGFGTYEQVPVDQLDLSAADFRRGGGRAKPASGAEGGTPASTPPAVPAPSAAEVAEARALIHKAIEGKGGLQKLQAIRALTARASTTMHTPNGPLQASTMTYIEYPDRFRVDATVAVGEIVQTYAAGQAWVKDPEGVRDAPDEMKESFRRRVKCDVIALLLAASRGELAVRLAPDVPGGGGKALKAVEITVGEIGPVVLAIDPDSGLVVKETYRSREPDGERILEEEFSDYRSVDGVQVAFKAVVRREGATLVDRVVSEIKLNPAIDQTLFKKPSGH
ncbi:MAG: insulinase family protein [Acidobacteria bacterium]|nr:insulinase family protein [Acidobacteriota bacterium]